MNRWTFSLLLLFPFSCWASGDPAAIWWVGAVLVVHCATVVWILLQACKRQASFLLLLMAVGACVCGWWKYLGLRTDEFAFWSIGLMLVPVAFVVPLLAGKARRSGPTRN